MEPDLDLPLAEVSRSVNVPAHPGVIRALQIGPVVTGLAWLLSALVAPIKIDGSSSILLTVFIASVALALASDVYVLAWRQWVAWPCANQDGI